MSLFAIMAGAQALTGLFQGLGAKYATDEQNRKIDKAIKEERAQSNASQAYHGKIGSASASEALMLNNIEGARQAYANSTNRIMNEKSISANVISQLESQKQSTPAAWQIALSSLTGAIGSGVQAYQLNKYNTNLLDFKKELLSTLPSNYMNSLGEPR